MAVIFNRVLPLSKNPHVDGHFGQGNMVSFQREKLIG